MRGPAIVKGACVSVGMHPDTDVRMLALRAYTPE